MSNSDQRVSILKNAKNPDLRELGLVGLKVSGGYIYEEFERKLAGDKAIDVYREMADNDPVVGAILFAVDMFMRQVEWKIEPASESQQDQDRADFVTECLHDMSQPWADTVSTIMSFLPYGFSYHEIVYKIRKGVEQSSSTRYSKFDDGKIGWRKLPIRLQNTRLRWDIDDEGGIKGMYQLVPNAPAKGIMYIPIEKALLFRTTAARGSPEGRSVLRTAFRPWYFKRRIEEIEAIGVERDLAGLPVFKVPAPMLSDAATDEEKATLDAFQKIARNIRRDEQEGLVLPLAYDDNHNEIYKFELMSSGGSRNFDTDKIIRRYENRIAMALLADFILLGHERAGGAFALSASKISLWSSALDAWATEIDDVFTEIAIPRLMLVNGWDVSSAPKMVHAEIKEVDLAAIANMIDKLHSSGSPLFPNAELTNHILRLAGLPTLPEAQASKPPPLPPVTDQPPTSADPAKPAAIKPTAKPTNVPTKGGPVPSRQPNARVSEAAARTTKSREKK